MSCPVHRPSATLVLLPALLYGALTALAIGGARAADVTAHEPHVALILPLGSPSYGRHAEAVRQGFLAAAKVARKDAPPIRIYPVNEDTLNVLTIYEQAIESGARLVVGPLTRSGVAALATSNLVTVPTLTLNTIGPSTPQPARMYLFGLNIELEARQIARLAIDDGRRNAFVISDDTPLGKRMRQTFVEKFEQLGGNTVAEFDRMYALGIDAFRIGLDLLRRRHDPVLDGVTGRIRLIRNQQYARELTAAQYLDGKTVILGEPRP